MGMRFSRSDQHYCDPTFLLKQLELDRAVIVSIAHLFSSARFERMKLTPEGEAEQLGRENDFVADCVGKHPDRLVGYFSINLLRDYAPAELEPSGGQTWYGRREAALASLRNRT
jgi:hypothetical protein